MEIELVHTTGSPSRQDSDSEPHASRKQLTISSSEMALHRKQSRRSKKQMSERQRRKRMNNSMDKLGLLVYGKTFQDGLKVDKATLLKDAYVKLETMKDDYCKGYETAISSTQSFLDGLLGCPSEVKDALNRHLKNTLQMSMKKYQSTASPAAGESSSDSCSPKPSSPVSLQVIVPREDLPKDSGSRHSDLSPRMARRVVIASSSSCKSSCQGEAAVKLDAAPILYSPHPQHPVVSPHPQSHPAIAAQSQRSPSRTVAQMTPLHVPKTIPPGELIGSTENVHYRKSSLSVSPCSTPASVECLQNMAWSFKDTLTSMHPLQKDLHLLSSYPQHICPGCPYLSPVSTSSSTPKISPYVTPYAPQNPLYLDSTTSGMVFGLSDIPVYPGSRLATPPYTSIPPLAARFRAPIIADDSGYASPGVPSPRSAAGVCRGSGKHYMSRMGNKAGRVYAAENTDEENDREVEQVFARSRRYDSDGAASQSD